MWKMYVCPIFFYIGIWQWAIHHQITAAITFSVIFFLILEYIFQQLNEIRIRVELIQIQTKIKD